MESNIEVHKYRFVESALRERISSGKFQTGDKFCTEAELKKQYQCSSVTVVRAIKELERQGYLQRKRGCGTFIKALHPNAPALSGDQSVRELIIAGAASSDGDAVVAQAQNPQNWFIQYEFQRGVISRFAGHMHIVGSKGVLDLVDRAGGTNCGVIVRGYHPEIAAILSERCISHSCVIGDPSLKESGLTSNVIRRVDMPGIYRGMSYLICDLGHERIGLIAGGRFDHRERLAGYRISLETFHLPFNEGAVITCKYGGGYESGYEAMKDLLAGNPGITAVFVDTDIKALGAIKAVRDAGLRVPEDISILGFDDVPGVEQADPPLTTIRVPHFEMGAEAVNMIMRSAENGFHPVPGITMESKLIVRKSCAPAKTSSTSGEKATGRAAGAQSATDGGLATRGAWPAPEAADGWK